MKDRGFSKNLRKELFSLKQVKILSNIKFPLDIFKYFNYHLPVVSHRLFLQPTTSAKEVIYLTKEVPSFYFQETVLRT